MEDEDGALKVITVYTGGGPCHNQLPEPRVRRRGLSQALELCPHGPHKRCLKITFDIKVNILIIYNEICPST